MRSVSRVLPVIVALVSCQREVPPPLEPERRQDARVIDSGVIDRDGGARGDVVIPEDGSAPDDTGVEPADAGGEGDATASAPDGGPEDTGPIAADATADAGDAGVPADPCAAGAGDDGARYALVLACLRDPAASVPTRRAAIDRFVREVEEAGGFPIRDGSDLVYVYVRTAQWDAEDDGNAAEDFDPARRVAPITVSGDFNGWVADGPPLTDEGLDFFHARVPAPAPGPTRSGYKLVARDAGGATFYFSDPLSRRFDYDAFGRISFSRGGADRGHLERFRSVRATRLANERVVYVWLPPGYEGSAARYPVLYMHDGNNLFDPAQPNSAPAGSWQVDEAMEAELTAGRIRPAIVVGVPNNADRFAEYTQVADDLGNGPVGGDAADYADFLVNDLKPRVDARFRTLVDRANTGVLGSSLGGLVSFYIGAQHPTVFRFVGGMSSTFAWGRLGATMRTIIQDYADATDLVARGQVYYLDSGGNPPTGGCASITGGGDNYCATLAMRDALVAGGITTFPDDPGASPLMPAGVNIYHWHEAGASHSESAWRARMFRPLRLFLRP